MMTRWTGLAPREFESLFQVALHLPSKQASNCSWVVSVGIDGDDAVAPFFVHDLLETARREISRAPSAAVRAVFFFFFFITLEPRVE